MVKLRILLLSAMLCLPTLSCNLFKGVESASTPQELYNLAVALANSGDCTGARDTLKQITELNDDMRVALGWTYMCIAGATPGSIASTIYKYTGSANDLTIMGTLARTMMPLTGEKLEATALAVAAFEAISDSRKNIEAGIGNFVRAAAILGKQGANDGSSGQLNRIDIASAACDALANDCVGFAAACTESLPTTMSDTDASAFTTTVSRAAAFLGAEGTSELKTLAQNITNDITGLGNDFVRCYIQHRTIPAN